ncbi:hypothetical protein ACJJTC_002114 [Scirpophaga incertulas]
MTSQEEKDIIKDFIDLYRDLTCLWDQKKKVDHLKYSYQREIKKVKESKNRTGSAASEVYRPNLWYFEHLSFLEKKNNAKRTGVDSLMDEDENDERNEFIVSIYLFIYRLIE